MWRGCPGEERSEPGHSPEEPSVNGQDWSEECGTVKLREEAHREKLVFGIAEKRSVLETERHAAGPETDPGLNQV